MAGKSEGFCTMNGYNMLSKGEITSAKENYSEMIVRKQRDYNILCAVTLSNQLHVKASSVSIIIHQFVRVELVNEQGRQIVYQYKL